MNVFRLVVLGMVFGMADFGQQVEDPYITGMNLFSSAGCPIFVLGMVTDSPADHAGIRAGDEVLRVDGSLVKTGEPAAQLIRSDRPKPVSMTLKREGGEFEAVVDREKASAIFERSGKRMTSGLVVPFDTTQTEIRRMLDLQNRRPVARVFPSHYPLNPEVFYGGFEIFILGGPAQVTVGGIEDGPATKVGLRWGDVLMSVNGVSTSGKTKAQLEALFSASKPAFMHLQVDRAGSLKTFDLPLEKAREIAAQNGKRFVNGRLVPAWATEEYLHCFLK